MLENGYITVERGDRRPRTRTSTIRPRSTGTRVYSAEYFTEEVRRQLRALYGEDQLYGGGLSVRTTLDPKLQEYARKALMDGLIAYDQTEGFRGPVASIELGDDWGVSVNAIEPLRDVPEWRLAVVLEMASNEATIGLRPGRDVDGKVSPERTTATLAGPEIKWVSKALSDVLKVGDVIYVSPVEGKPGVYTLQQVPEIEGALVAMDPRTGRVLAMVGGFSFAESEFNRATQALRQPGSSFKPIVYSAALDNGYTPASVVLDAPIEIVNGDGSVWRPENYAQEFYGPQTLRVGIEKSRNVMTVRLAKDIGMPLVAEYAKMFGVYDSLNPLLAMALGAGETTDMRMTAAFATIANGGRRIVPTLIDRIQDRYGKTVYKHDAARLRRLRHRRLGRAGRAADHRQPRAGARPDDGVPDHLDDGGRRRARDRHCAQECSTGRWPARPARRATTRTPGSSASRPNSRWASTSASTSRGTWAARRPAVSLAVPVFTEFMQAALEGKPATRRS